MSNFEEDGIDVESLKEDDSVEWWRATKKDNFDLTTKLLRTGCRPIKRQYLECIRGETFDEFKNCQVLKGDLEKCVKMLKYIYATKPDH